MADKMHTLIVGGNEVQVPAWASESTMGQVASYMAQQAKTDTMFAKMMKGIGGDLGELQAEIQGLVGATQTDIKADDIADTEQEKFTKKLVKGSSKLDKAMGFFGNHEKPLSAMTDGLSSLAKGAKGAGGGFKLLEGMTKSTSGLMQGAGASLNVAADAFLAYAGWNAAKLEQFANVQSKIIDSGILFEGGARAYDELRKGIQNTGNTYLHLTETLGTFSDGMLGLGDNVATGAMEFSKFYQALNTSAESLGDLGMSSKDMLTAYGEYISYSRRTGQLNKRLNRSADDVNSTFINMQIEAGAIANLTSLSRSEAMRASMEAMDTYGSAANRILIDKGMINQASLQTDVMQSLGKIAGSSEAMQSILDAYNFAALKHTGDPSQFDLSAIIQNFTPGLEAQMNNLVPGMIDSIEEFTRTGTAPAEGMMSWIVTQINGADQTKLAAAGVAGDTFATSLLKLQAEFQSITLNFGNLADGDKLKTAIDNQKKDIAEAGKTTQAMNEMTEKFIKVQEALTLDMENTAMLFDGLKASLEGGKAMLDKILVLAGFGDELNDFGGAGGDKELLAAAIAGVTPDVSNNEAMEAPAPVEAGKNGEVVGVDENSTAGKAVAAMRDNDGNVTVEMLNELNISQLHDMENAVIYLNSLSKGFKEKAIKMIANYNDEMAETGQKLVIFGGRTEKVNEEDPDDYSTAGMQMNIAVMQDDKLVKDQKAVLGPDTAFARAMKDAGLSSGQDNDGVDTPMKNIGVVKNHDQHYGSNLFKNTDKNFLGFGGTVKDGVVSADSSLNEGVEMQDAAGKKVIANAPGRKAGGPVTAGQPYIVGDQLGMDTAELFIPHSSGNIVNNRELNESMDTVGPSNDISQAQTNIKNIQNGLTNIEQSVTMNNSQDLSELAASKKSAIETVKTLQSIVKRYNISEKSKTVANIMNSR
jgi:hypothetical protein